MSESSVTPSWKTGLSEAEAQARLKAEGYNELPRPDSRTTLRIVLEVLREPMLALLIAGGIVYLALGDWREALILLVFANLSIVITVIQETRTERVLEALRDLTSPRALVIRAASANGFRAGRWRAATWSRFPKAIAFPRTLRSSNARICRSMNRC